MQESIRQNPLDKKPRYWELDFMRGFCVLLMVFDHFMYSLGGIAPIMDGIFGMTLWEGASNFVWDIYWFGVLRTSTHLLVVFCFFIICGISCTFSRSNIKRGALCFLFGCVITYVTVIADRIFETNISIYFGVLHMLGIAMMLYGAIDKLGERIKKLGKTDESKAAAQIIGDYLAPTIGLILLIVYFACLGHIENWAFVPNVEIEDKSTSVLASLFFEVKTTVENSDWMIGGDDYFPFLPWVAIVLIGGFIGRGIYHNPKTQNYLVKLDGKWNKPVCFVGRHAIIVYLAHQVAIGVLIFLISLIARLFMFAV